MAKFKTKLTEMCGIEHPIIQGGMHYVGYAEMAAAVSNAGGLGVITALTVAQPPRGAEALRDEIKKCRALTNKPFAVNITLLPVGVPPDYEGIVKVLIEEGVKIVETAGHRVCCTTITGIKLKEAGIPFVASGGCATGKQLAAALAMGAEGMNMGTAFMATVESPIHAGIKKALVDADERSTTHVFRSLGNTERVFKNAQAMKVREIEAENPGDFGAIWPYVKGELYRQSFQETGDPESSVWSCGQSIGLIDDVITCKELVTGIVDEAAAIIQHNLGSMVVTAPAASLHAKL
eukprot:gene12920-13083_t